MGRKGHPLAARIKKIMQTDEDVGKIAQATPIMIARALELFLERLCKNASEVAAGRKAKTLTCSHVKAYVNSDELMDFLADTVAKAPDLPPEGEAEAPKAKRQRTGEPKPRAPKGEGKGKAKRESAEGSAAAAAAAAGDGDGGDPTAAAAADGGAGAQPLAALPPAAVQAVKQDPNSSSSPTAAQAKPGFGGLGAHPFLAARTFGKSGVKKGGAAASSSPKPTLPLGKQQAGAAATAATAFASLQQQQQQQQPLSAARHDQQQQQQPASAANLEQQQQQDEQEQSAYAKVAPSLLPGLTAKILAGFAVQQQQQAAAAAAEDDYDDDYDS